MKHLLPLIVTFLLTACAIGSGLETHRNRDVDLTGLQTFRILPNYYHSPTAPMSVAAAKQEIERAIQAALREKGYRRAVGEQPADFDVEYLMYVTERYQEGVHDRYIFGGSVRLLGGAESLLDDPIREGALHIHLLKNGKPFYESIASDVIETGMPIDKRIRTTVPRMLSDLPARCCE